jgi:DNA invertase Pin-like site-specific DNA recombinase
MRQPTELQKKQSARLQELIAIARQRYLDAGGDPRRCPSGRKGDDYMTDEERQEALELMRKIAGVRIVGDEVHCQGRSWKISPTPVQPVA